MRARFGVFAFSACSNNSFAFAGMRPSPANARAKAGLRRVAQAFVVQANAALDENNISAAEKLLQQADAIAPDLADLRAAKSRLRESREQREIAGKKSEITPADQSRIDAMLVDADAALAAGNLVLPPGDSAYDKYRAVLRIDGNNAKAFAGLGRIPAKAKELFELALKANTPNRARIYLDAISDIDPGDASVAGLRERLANVFLDQAEARAGQGMRGDAERALTSARELSPNNPRLAGVGQKIQALPATPTGG